MKGRRIPIVEGADPFSMLTEAGDYYGPVKGWTGEALAVFFLLPIARDAGVHPEARSMRAVTSPPHKFYEQPNGTLTIKESILSRWSDGSGQWHGYLTAGEWIES